MKLTKETLKQIIKEEVQAALEEQNLEEAAPGMVKKDMDILAKDFGLDPNTLASVMGRPEVQAAMTRLAKALARSKDPSVTRITPSKKEKVIGGEKAMQRRIAADDALRKAGL